MDYRSFHLEQPTGTLRSTNPKTSPPILYPFDKFITFVNEYVIKNEKVLTPFFGLEDTKGFGRSLSAYVVGHKYVVKSVNPALANKFRKSAPTYKVMIISATVNDNTLYQNEGIESEYNAGNIIIFDVIASRDGERQIVQLEWHVTLITVG